MPVISNFFGIKITMYGNDHNPPHIHASYGGSKACFDFDGDIIAGAFPNTKRKLVEAWIEIHYDELCENWERAVQNKTLYKIQPLR